MQDLIIEADEIKTVKGKNYEKYGAVSTRTNSMKSSPQSAAEKRGII